MLSGAFEHAGITHVSWWSDGYQGAPGAFSRRALAAENARWAGVLSTWYMEDRDSAVIRPDIHRTPSEAAVVEAIRQFHDMGLNVMLNPHVDVQDGFWRGSMKPPDVDGWFASYATYMATMARLAEAQRVEMLCVGTEMTRLSGAEFRSRWAEVIARVRAEYHGPLIYAANANTVADEFTGVSFWDLLDFAGLDVYAPLTDEDEPTLGELKAGWSRNPRGDNMLAAIRNWQRSHGKPVIFTEIGYRSIDGANRAPWDYSVTAPYDEGEQRDCYEAAFSVWLPERSWLKGIFWWSWDVPEPLPGDTDYTPRGKPAGDFLRWRYSADAS